MLKSGLIHKAEKKLREDYACMQKKKKLKFLLNRRKKCVKIWLPYKLKTATEVVVNLIFAKTHILYKEV